MMQEVLQDAGYETAFIGKRHMERHASAFPEANIPAYDNWYDTMTGVCNMRYKYIQTHRLWTAEISFQ
jgi:arylsulfatase A-like enzyme